MIMFLEWLTVACLIVQAVFLAMIITNLLDIRLILARLERDAVMKRKRAETEEDLSA